MRKFDILKGKSSSLSRHIWLFVLIIIIVGTCFPYRMFWWTVTPGGDVGDDETGTTLGQAAIGSVRGTSDLGDGSYGFWYEGFEPVVCFEITHDTWDLDSIDNLETRTMTPGEEIAVTNCGNCHLNFGINFVDSDPLDWTWGYSAGNDKFVLRASFTDLPTSPTFDPTRDYIKDIITWATDDIFGPLGQDFGFEEDLNLWLQFYSPGRSTLYGGNTITILLQAQANLP